MGAWEGRGEAEAIDAEASDASLYRTLSIGLVRSGVLTTPIVLLFQALEDWSLYPTSTAAARKRCSTAAADPDPPVPSIPPLAPVIVQSHRNLRVSVSEVLEICA
jgi:hypothetical protein